ncbi:MAG TPA: IS1595 family transposase [Verrucomicrobiae bacterium]|nr:IS1595 family transposase [Verrucomicrobiae bacterium]
MNRRQTIPKHLRYTLDQFKAEFPNDDVCLEAIKEQRYPGGVTYCAECAQDRKLYRVAGRTAYACECGHQFYPLAGTIFEKSTTPLHIWFYAMYQMGSTRCGISAKQIQRETGVTYKTAWRMFRQIRSLLSEGDMQLEGSTIEMDEMYYGGTSKGHAGRPMRGDKQKTPVIGIVERSNNRRVGRVKALATPDVTSERVMGIVHEHILPKSTVFTDEYIIYDRLGARVQEHKRINHSSKVYVMGDVHTNTIEGFWSLVKRGIGGVYHSVGQKYLQSYLNEYSFRYNRRDQGNLIFGAILARVSEKASSKPSAPVARIQPV